MFRPRIEALRQRRQRGTRVPMDWMYESHSYLFNFFFAFALPAGGGIDLLFRHEALWQRTLGVVLLSFVALEIVLFIRWLRLPIDDDAFEARNNLRTGWMFDQTPRIPPRSIW